MTELLRSLGVDPDSVERYEVTDNASGIILTVIPLDSTIRLSWWLSPDGWTALPPRLSD